MMSRVGKSTQKADEWLPGDERKEEQEVIAKGYQGSSWGDENILNLASGDAYITCGHIKTCGYMKTTKLHTSKA